MHIPTTALAMALAAFCASASASPPAPASGEMPLFQEKELSHPASALTEREAVRAQARAQPPLAGEVPAPSQPTPDAGQGQTQRLAAPQRRPQHGDAG